MAPISPFMSDRIHHDLTGESVHMADWPLGSSLVEKSLPPQDLDLEQKMSLVRTLTETGRRIRVDSNRRQRLPCQSGWIVGGMDLTDFHSIIAEELNVENLETEKNLDRFQRIEVVPNHKVLGKKCRADLPKVLSELANIDSEILLADIEKGNVNVEGYDITMEDVSLRRVEKEGFAAATFADEELGDISLVLDMEINENLLSKGLAREITRRVQSKRKDLDLDLEDTITLNVWLSEDSPKLNSSDWEYVKSETRASSSDLQYASPSEESESFEVDELKIYFNLKKN